MKLTVCWLTSRRQGCSDWFLRSLQREAGADYPKLRIVLVNFHCRRPLVGHNLVHVAPKPTVWQGQHRLTQHDYFAAANARNTGLCYAPDGWIAYVDDLSVLMPGWLAAVRQAMKGSYVVCGAFRKVLKLVLPKLGEPTFEDHPAGHDSRWKDGQAGPVDCPPNWLFGCSVAGPVDAFLKINGWPELCDSTGVGCEDCLTGHALGNSGHKLKYDQRMFTLESEEGHHLEKPMLRLDKGKIGTPDSKSHALVRLLQDAKHFHLNDFSPFPDLAALRRHVLSGGEFPVVGKPTHDWYDGVTLSEL